MPSDPTMVGPRASSASAHVAMLASIVIVGLIAVLTWSAVPVAAETNEGSATARSSEAKLAAGDAHTCVIMSGGAVRCWGDNTYGQLGAGLSTNSSTTPVAAVGVADAVAVSAGEFNTCVLVVDHTVRCWGDNAFGQVGDGTVGDVRSSASMVIGLSGVVEIAAGGGHTCALLVDATARCWGLNFSGELGDGTTVNSPIPVAVVGLGAIVSIAAGGTHTCALLIDSTVRCWGGNYTGQLGDGTAIPNSLVPVTPAVSNVVAVVAAGRSSCALLMDGTARCWGWNSDGQLGDGTTIDSHVPVPVRGVTNAVALSSMYKHSCALISDGTARCWGANSLGQLGDGTTVGSPLAVSTAINHGAAITVGRFHTCVLQDDTTLQCWGADGFAPDGQIAAHLRPVTVIGGSAPPTDIPEGRLAVANLAALAVIAMAVRHRWTPHSRPREADAYL